MSSTRTMACDAGDGENLLGAEEHGDRVAQPAFVSSSTFGRGKVVFAGIVGTVALLSSAIACAGQLAKWRAPRSNMILSGGSIGLSAQLNDDEGRCLAPSTFKAGEQLVLVRCQANAKKQFFTIDRDWGTITMGDDVGNVLCATQSRIQTESGMPLLLDICIPGWVPQRIVGKCLRGESSKNGAKAFVEPCRDGFQMPEAGASLFCFMGVLPGSGEEALRDTAAARGASIFACEASRVYESEPQGTYTIDDGQTFTANIGVFLKIWQQVFDEQVYKSHDWTVKVDPDAVWMPQRLRDRLLVLHTKIDEVLYIKNTYMSFGFLGPIEIMSQGAVERLSYVAANSCMVDGGGEDGWLMACMDSNGISSGEDRNILNSHCLVEECGDSSFVAFHYFKDPDSWNACYDRMR